MDISDSESDAAADESESDWVESEKRPRKKRNSKPGGQARVGLDINCSENSRTENSGTCCSCSKSSLCKLKKCECRAAGGTCGDSCSCAPHKCTNRETVKAKELDDFPQSALAEDIGNLSGSDDTRKYNELASHGAALLQSALVDEPAEANVGCESKRKPLSEIGNKMVCCYSCTVLGSIPLKKKKDCDVKLCLQAKTAVKPSQRKKWRKSVIQLVPVAPPLPQPELTEPPKKAENNIEADMPLKLPRAMRSAASNGNPFRVRNSDHPQGSSASNKDIPPVSGSPVRPARASEEKENYGP